MNATSGLFRRALVMRQKQNSSSARSASILGGNIGKMDFNVLVAGKRNSLETEPLLTFLNQEEIPHSFVEIGEDFDAKIPASYIGGYQVYGSDKDSLKQIKDFYEITLRNIANFSSPQQYSSP